MGPGQGQRFEKFTCEANQATGAMPLRMVASSDVKPMPVRSKLREEAAFMMPKHDMSVKDRVRCSYAVVRGLWVHAQRVVSLST